MASDEELRAFGIGVPAPRDKVDGLAEAIEIIRGLWTEAALTCTGRIHHVVAAPMEPKPARRSPVWLGTFGPRALAVTGRLADGWMPSLSYAPLDRLPGMRDRVATAAAAAGRSMDDITCAPNVEVRVGDVRPGVISGSPDQVAERLRALTGMGFTVLNLKPSGPGRDEQVERLAREVLPAVWPAPLRPSWSSRRRLAISSVTASSTLRPGSRRDRSLTSAAGRPAALLCCGSSRILTVLLRPCVRGVLDTLGARGQDVKTKRLLGLWTWGQTAGGVRRDHSS
ncbi:LLM class flavin-dependent oxidoreductase [Dactylosporangium sp. NPDC000521]|uniref:LLM class flavin-dependent oxidoreductase n=2 Tax=unclassified Dactylosporangium TaxID=2621675 RepID=UPI0036967C9B